jgi:hypothetical protein
LLLQDDEVGKTRCDGVSDDCRITLLLLGSSSLCESDRMAKGSPIERIYESYGKAENIAERSLQRIATANRSG